MRHVAETVNWPRAAFRDREEAGERLAEFLRAQGARVEAVLAVPSGGVPVGRAIARSYGVPLDVVLVRKLPLPQNPEMGFGAVTLEGQVVINEEVADAFGVSKARAECIMGEVLAGLRERRRRLAGDRSSVDVAGRHVLAVDDGLATGVTMRAALSELRRRGTAGLGLAVPASPLATLAAVEPLADEVYCLLAQRTGSFAVASFYAHWYDMSDTEAAEALRDYAAEGGPPDAAPQDRRPGSGDRAEEGGR
jgi:putative phosphoribosyl transferase